MKKETIDSLSVARRIRAAGRPIHIAEDDCEAPGIPSDGLRVFQWGGVHESRLVDCSGGTAIVILLAITINLPQFGISGFGLELPWKQKYFHWLQDPLEIDGTSQYYRFGFRDSLEYERSQVLNHRAGVEHPYAVGTQLRGLLLGQSFHSIPEDYPHGTMVPAFVIIYDQQGRQYRSTVKLWVNRMGVRRAVLPKRNMLDHPDSQEEIAAESARRRKAFYGSLAGR